jgi:hypothetical protein
VGGGRYGQVNGIAVLSGNTQVLAINSGLLLNSNFTVSPTTFVNQGTLSVSNGDSLSVSGLTGNLGAATLSGSGSSLALNGNNYVVDQGLTATAGQTLALSGTWQNSSSIAVTGATFGLNGTWANGSVPLGVTVQVYSGFTGGGGGAPYSNPVGSFNSNAIAFGASQSSFNWHPFGLGGFGADITASIDVATAGSYSFPLTSDDGSLLFIDGTKVVDNSGHHGPTTVTGSVSLSAGVHTLEVQFEEDGTGTSGVDLPLPSGITYVANNFSTPGTITAANSTVNLGGSTPAIGSVAITGSTLNIVGSFTTAQVRGIYSTTQVALNSGGLVDNTGDTLALDAGTGSWTIHGGTLKNGTYSSANGAVLLFTSSGGTLDGLTAAGDLDLTTNSGASMDVKDGLTLNNATIRLGNVTGSTSGRVLFDNTETLGGTGTVLLGNNSSNYVYAAGTGNATLTIGSGITVRGAAGRLTDYYTGTIINQGAIQADGSVGSGDFGYDTGFSGGTVESTTVAIDTSSLSSPVPAYVFQSDRYATSLSYTLSGLTPGNSYTVNLYFAENDYTHTGANTFNVSLNGTTVLSNFDIFGTAGAQHKAVVETFTASADNNGQIAASFVGVGGGRYGQVNGIAVLSGNTQVLAINSGLLLNSNFTVSPTTFVNQGTLSATNGDTLNVANLQPNQGTIDAGAGSRVSISGNLVQASSGAIDVEIAGTAASQVGMVTVSGTATLAGTLTATFVGGFVPVSGNTFKVLTFASASGTFSTVTGVNLPNGLNLTAVYDTTDVRLQVS